ncbi:MAG TPA: alkaline phosphatase family protein, partial [Chryseosolibacter sp.]
MTNSRRDFLKKVALVSGGAGMWSALPPSIQKAMAIAPDPGTTFYDAEHVVLLMQENRSFDHCFGTLRGVRGFNDPFPVALPGKIPVWFQPDKSGNRFLPFRLNIKDTRATWMGGVAHSWADQVDARNEGKYDGWIEAKRPGNEEFKNIPLTMGYYTRQDIPFYYALADAFTICDQHFCSSLTGTTTNRTYFWSGKTHGAPGEKPRVRNGELTYEKMGAWTTFPERLEDHGFSWRVYQNEISLPSDVEDESLLGNFTDNNLEWFSQYGVFHHAGFRDYLVRRKRELEDQTAASGEKTGEELVAMKKELSEIKAFLEKVNADRAAGLSARAGSLHDKAFTTNTGDPHYHKVEEMTYTAEGKERT